MFNIIRVIINLGDNMERRIKIPQPIKIIIIVGLISLIPYVMVKSLPEKEEYVDKNNTYQIKNLSYKIPLGFEIDSYSDDEYKYYSYNEESIYCNISLEVHSNKYDLFKTGEDYLKNRLFFTLSDTLSEITEENNWYTITKTTKQGSKEVSTAYTDKEYVYLLEFSLSDYQNGEELDKVEKHKCLDAYEYVYKSLKLQTK